MNRHKYIIKNCIVCNKEIQIRSDYIKIHRGKCQSCMNKEVINRPERKLININSLKGKIQSEQTKQKRSLALKGIRRSIETIEKIRMSNTGKKRTVEQCKKISERMKGKYIRLGCKLTDEQKKTLSISHQGQIGWNKGKKMSKEFCNNISKRQIGKKFSKETKNKMSMSSKNSINTGRFRKGIIMPRGDLSPSWKGGLTSFKLTIRQSQKSIEWRKKVFERDNYECVFCKILNVKFSKILNAHHIIRFEKLLKEYNIKSYEDAEKCDNLWNIDNGITLCKFCHDNVHKKERRNKNVII